MILQLSSCMRIYGKVFGLLVTVMLGVLFPHHQPWSLLIRYSLMDMGFLAFLDIDFKPQTFPKSGVWILLANVLVAFLSYALLVSFDLELHWPPL